MTGIRPYRPMLQSANLARSLRGSCATDKIGSIIGAAAACIYSDLRIGKQRSSPDHLFGLISQLSNDPVGRATVFNPGGYRLRESNGGRRRVHVAVVGTRHEKQACEFSRSFRATRL